MAEGTPSQAVATAPPPGTRAGVNVRAEAGAALRQFLGSLLSIQLDLVSASAAVAFLADGRARRLGVAAQLVAEEHDPAVVNAAGAILPTVSARMEKLAAALIQPTADGRPSPGVAEQVVLGDSGGLYGARPSHLMAATPLLADGRVHGACVVAVPIVRGVDPSGVITQLALTIARFEAFVWRDQCEQEAIQRTKLREALELLDAAQQGESVGAMAAIVCHELARRFGCTRASVGLFGGIAGRDRMTLIGVSGADQLDRRGEAAVLLEAAMEECADQEIEVFYPPPEEFEHEASQRRVTRAHAELSRKAGPSAILSLPLRVEGDLVGVLVLERGAAEPFPTQAAALLRLVSEFVGPSLWTRRLADRGIAEVTRDRIMEFGRILVGPRYTAAKLVGGVILLIVLLAATVPIPATIRADAEVRASLSRTIVPPFVGYIHSTNVKPGDAVKAGQILATMDTLEIEAQIASLEQRRGVAQTQRDEARSTGELGKAVALQAQIAGLEADLRQWKYKLDNAEIRSPIDGVVGRGEIDQIVGARADPSQAMFEIVTPQRLAVLLIKERDIRDVRIGGEGTMIIRAKPGTEVPIRVTRITPIAEVVRDDNVFAVEAEITGTAEEWLPGMTGYARIDNGWTTWMVRILKPLVDQARMRFWI